MSKIKAESQVMRPSLSHIQTALLAKFPQAHIKVVDESHLHAGHEGAKSGAGHFRVVIGHPELAAMRRVMAHRLVYDALQLWIPTGIHALAIEISDGQAHQNQ
jgi:BolA family transcriptional regulator, general stress-responsive regulator